MRLVAAKTVTFVTLKLTAGPLPLPTTDSCFSTKAHWEETRLYRTSTAISAKTHLQWPVVTLLHVVEGDETCGLSRHGNVARKWPGTCKRQTSRWRRAA